jgi:hypothetical protein
VVHVRGKSSLYFGRQQVLKRTGWVILKEMNVVAVNAQELFFITRLKMHNSYKQKKSSKNKKSKVYTHINKKDTGKENGAYERNLKHASLTTYNKL